MNFREFLEGKQWATYDPFIDEYLDDQNIKLDKEEVNAILHEIEMFLFKYKNHERSTLDFLGNLSYSRQDGRKEICRVLLHTINYRDNEPYYKVDGVAYSKNKKVILKIDLSKKIWEQNFSEILENILKEIKKMLYHEIGHMQRPDIPIGNAMKKVYKQTNDYQRKKVYSTEVGSELDAETTALAMIYNDLQ